MRDEGVQAHGANGEYTARDIHDYGANADAQQMSERTVRTKEDLDKLYNNEYTKLADHLFSAEPSRSSADHRRRFLCAVTCIHSFIEMKEGSPPSTLIDLIEENDMPKAKKAVQGYYQNKGYISDVKNRYGHMREQALTFLRSLL